MLDEVVPLVIVEVARPVGALLGLCDTLNEALFVVREPAIGDATTPYRG